MDSDKAPGALYDAVREAEPARLVVSRHGAAPLVGWRDIARSRADREMHPKRLSCAWSARLPLSAARSISYEQYARSLVHLTGTVRRKTEARWRGALHADGPRAGGGTRPAERRALGAGFPRGPSLRVVSRRLVEA